MKFILILQEIYFALRVPMFVNLTFHQSGIFIKITKSSYNLTKLLAFWTLVWNHRNAGLKRTTYVITNHPERKNISECSVNYGFLGAKYRHFFAEISIGRSRPYLFSYGDLFRRRGQANYCPAASAWINCFPPKNIQNEDAKMAR